MPPGVWLVSLGNGAISEVQLVSTVNRLDTQQ